LLLAAGLAATVYHTARFMLAPGALERWTFGVWALASSLLFLAATLLGTRSALHARPATLSESDPQDPGNT
jgi:hypothetical protein